MTRPRRWVSHAVVGGAAIAVGVLVVGPPGGNGLLANLDLIAVGDLDVPASLLAMGPEIPRRAPLQATLALLSPPFDAATMLRLWMIAIVAVAATGMFRAVGRVAVPLRIGAALLFALNPFLLTRLAVGHLGFATAVAMMPWAAPTLLGAPDRPRTEQPAGEGPVSRATLLWLAAFAMCGYFGALIAGPMVVLRLVADRHRPGPTDVASMIVTQIPWLAPAIAAAGSASGAVGSESFETHVDTVADGIRLVIGFGFWRTSNQLGSAGAAAVIVALVGLMLAVVALRFSPRPGLPRLAALGLVGLAVAAASAVPGVSDAYNELTESIVFAPLREGQRLLALTVFASIALSTAGLAAVLDRRPVGRWVVGAAAAGAALGLSASALWGLDGAADGYRTPGEWQEVADVVERDGGSVLALPWSQYFDLDAAGGTRAHTPLPALLGGDVVFRHDLGLGATTTVARDDRTEVGARLVRELRFGEPIDASLAELGVRWIVALPDLDDGADIALLRARTELTTVVDEPSIALFRVDDGPVDSPTAPNPWGAVPAIVLALDAVWLGGVFVLVRDAATRGGPAPTVLRDGTGRRGHDGRDFPPSK